MDPILLLPRSVIAPFTYTGRIRFALPTYGSFSCHHYPLDWTHAWYSGLHSVYNDFWRTFPAADLVCRFRGQRQFWLVLANATTDLPAAGVRNAYIGCQRLNLYHIWFVPGLFPVLQTPIYLYDTVTGGSTIPARTAPVDTRTLPVHARLYAAVTTLYTVPDSPVAVRFPPVSRWSPDSGSPPLGYLILPHAHTFSSEPPITDARATYGF